MTQFIEAISNAKTKHEALNIKSDFNVFCGLKFKEMKTLSLEEKKIKGDEINKLKSQFEELFSQKLEALRRQEVEETLSKENVDITLSSFKPLKGGLHPVSFVINELVEIMQKYGFSFVKGPEIETNYYNFDALNIPRNHPARDMHDTFYLKFLDPNNENFLLRTHTSCTQIRGMKSGNPPFALISAGRTYRCDFDRTHTPMFNQLECLYIAKDVNMSNLLWMIDRLFKEFFQGIDVKVRLRPSFFPFTEPSAEVDIDIGDGFLEVMGAGMVHPNVLKECGVDTDEYSGFAFGVGIERLAMLKYKMTDLRDFFSSTKKWNEFYGFRI
jgi:phenylalanyl-tRNA synthetase alpha chain